jgi:hypothetical protein
MDGPIPAHAPEMEYPDQTCTYCGTQLRVNKNELELSEHITHIQYVCQSEECISKSKADEIKDVKQLKEKGFIGGEAITAAT